MCNNGYINNILKNKKDLNRILLINTFYMRYINIIFDNK